MAGISAPAVGTLRAGLIPTHATSPRLSAFGD